jgi:hypothetical protein
MLEYLENLRKKPEREKRKAILMISISVTLFIAAIWTVFMSMRIHSTDFSFDTSDVDKKVPSLKETFSNFTDQLGGFFKTQETATTSTPAPSPEP